MKKVDSVIANVPADAKLFIGCNIGEYCISYENEKEGFVNIPLYDDRFVGWMEEKNPQLVAQNPELVRCALHKLADVAGYEGMGKDVMSRIAQEGDKIFYNFMDGNVLVVEPGRTSLVEAGSLRNELFAFVNDRLMDVQDLPKQGNKVDLPEKIGYLLGLDRLDSILMAIVLVAMFVPKIFKPVLHIACKDDGAKAVCNYVLQALVDPIQEEAFCYSHDRSEEWAFAKRYLHVANTLKDVQDVFDINLENLTPCGSDMGSLRNCFVVNDIGLDLLTAKLASIVVTIKSKLIGNYEPLAEAKKVVEKERPDILNAIFEVLSKAMVVKETIAVEDFGDLTEFVQWARAIAAVIFGKAEAFDKVFALRKPLDDRLVPVMLFMDFYDHKVESAELDEIFDIADSLELKALYSIA